MITITVNGTPESLDRETTVAEYLESHNYQTSRIAVELNTTILPKARYGGTMLTEADTLEIVTFVGGG